MHLCGLLGMDVVIFFGDCSLQDNLLSLLHLRVEFVFHLFVCFGFFELWIFHEIPDYVQQGSSQNQSRALGNFSTISQEP